VKDLERAAELLEAGARVPGLEALLAVWRETRSRELAELIGVAGAELSRALPPIARHYDWLDTASLLRPWDVDRLLRALTLQPFTKLKDRVARLERFDDDPRIAAGLAAALDKLETPKLVMSPLFELLALQRDVRVKAMLQRRRHQREVRPTIGRALHKGLDGVFERLEEPAAPTPAERVLLKRVRRALATLAAGEPVRLEQLEVKREPTAPAGAELLQAIFASPSSDEPRKVYADWLMQRGDPRGELIALQLQPRSAASVDRQRELFERHGREWLGTLEPVVTAKLEDFERGFLAVARVRLITDSQVKQVPNDPAWALIRTLSDSSHAKAHRALMARTSFVSLEKLENALTCAVAATVRPCPKLGALMLELTRSRPEERRRLAASTAFPAVRHLDCVTLWETSDLLEPLGEILSGPLGASVETLRVAARDSSSTEVVTLRRWRELVGRLPNLSSLTVHGSPRICFERSGKRWRIFAENTEQLSRAAAAALKAALATFPEANR
jgi:uncharacterized protein (TIGR02996 family)